MKNCLPTRFLSACALLIAGGLWAATARAADAPAPAPADALIAQVKAYRFGDDRKPLVALELLIGQNASDTSARKAMCEKLDAILSSDASTDAKQFACRMLSAIGSAADVPALAKLLSDETMAASARLALERIGGEEPAAALHSALAGAKGNLRVGIINSLGVIRYEKAVADLVPLAGDSDEETARAAIRALGAIANEPAAKALSSLAPSAPAALKSCVGEALLRCVEQAAAAKRGDAAAMLGQLMAPSQPAPIRQAAFLMDVRLAGSEAAGRILAALGGEDAILQSAAIGALRASQDAAVLRAAAERLPTLPQRWQAAVVAILGDRGDASASAGLAKMVSAEDAELRRAVIVALGQVGDASAVAALLEPAARASADEQRLIVDSLARLRGADVEARLIESIKTASPAGQVLAIRALVLRAPPTALAAFTAAVQSDAPAVRREAIAALGEFGTEESVPVLMKALQGDPDAAVRSLGAICRRTGKLDAVLAELKAADAGKKPALLSVLAAVGGSEALAAVREQAKDANAEVQAAAVRTLSLWSDPTALDDVAALASTSPDARLKALAVRGLARLAPLAKDRAAEDVGGMLARAQAANAAAGERKTLLGAMGQVPALASLKAAAECLDTPELADEATQAVLKIVDAIGPECRPEATAALAKVATVSKDKAVLDRAAEMKQMLGRPANLARGATAKGTDGLSPDGQGGPASAAIDGKPETYWDETDNQKLYTLRVQLKRKSTVASLRITGFQHQSYAPKDFHVLLDGKAVKTVKDAAYTNNVLMVELPPTECSTLELRITGYYAQSPAIREVEIYGPAEK